MQLSLSNNINCYNDKNSSVDWWMILKIPYTKDISTGYEYVYYDNNTIDKTFNIHSGSLNDTVNPLYYTLTQLNKYKDTGYYLYNDEPFPTKNDNGYDYSFGHTKGSLQFDKNGGYWITHSIPRFPPIPTIKYYYPENEIEYGQSAMCLNINFDQLDIIGKQLRYTKPNVFNFNIPDEYDLPETKLLVKQIWHILHLLALVYFQT